MVLTMVSPKYFPSEKLNLLAFKFPLRPLQLWCELNDLNVTNSNCDNPNKYQVLRYYGGLNWA